VYVRKTRRFSCCKLVRTVPRDTYAKIGSPADDMYVGEREPRSLRPRAARPRWRCSTVPTAVELSKKLAPRSSRPAHKHRYGFLQNKIGTMLSRTAYLFASRRMSNAFTRRKFGSSASFVSVFITCETELIFHRISVACLSVCRSHPFVGFAMFSRVKKWGDFFADAQCGLR